MPNLRARVAVAGWRDHMKRALTLFLDTAIGGLVLWGAMSCVEQAASGALGLR
jgi:hypothetical protein